MHRINVFDDGKWRRESTSTHITTIGISFDVSFAAMFGNVCVINLKQRIDYISIDDKKNRKPYKDDIVATVVVD